MFSREGIILPSRDEDRAMARGCIGSLRERIDLVDDATGVAWMAQAARTIATRYMLRLPLIGRERVDDSRGMGSSVSCCVAS